MADVRRPSSSNKWWAAATATASSVAAVAMARPLTLLNAADRPVSFDFLFFVLIGLAAASAVWLAFALFAPRDMTLRTSKMDRR